MIKALFITAAFSLFTLAPFTPAVAESSQEAEVTGSANGDKFIVVGNGDSSPFGTPPETAPVRVFWSDCGEYFAGGDVSGACQQAAAVCAQALIDTGLNITTATLAEGETLHYLVQVREESDGSWTVLGEDCTHIETTTVVRDYQPAAYEAFTAHLPSPAITTTGNVNVVNFETLLWLDTDSDLSFTATLLGDAAEIHAHLESVTWDYGDGTTGTSSTA